MPSAEVRIRGIPGIPEIVPGADLCSLIVDALSSLRSATAVANPSRLPPLVQPHAVFVVAQKIVSKAEGRIVRLDTVSPSLQAMQWAAEFEKDPRMVEVVLREARRIVRMDRGVLIVETAHGYICANGGVDASNSPMGTVVLLPEDPDRSARELRERLIARLEVPISVIVSDTFGRPWRQGLVNVALGVAGISPYVDYRGKTDLYGRTLHATLLAAADELASAGEIVMGKTSGIPVAVIEGLDQPFAEGTGRDLIRPPEEDLFR